MNFRFLPWIGLAMLAAAIGFAQQAQRSNNEFYFFEEFKAKLLAGGKIQLSVVGKPIRADLKAQALKLEALLFEGVMVRAKAQNLAIATATISGNVNLTIIRPSSSKIAGLNQTVEIQSAKISYVGATNTVTSPGAVSIERSDVSASETMNLSAGSSEARLFEPGISSARSPFSSLHLDGGVKGSLVGIAMEEGKPVLDSNKKPKKTEINLTCTSLRYDDHAGKMTLSGNVKLWGDHPMLFGNIDAKQVVLIFSAVGEIDEIIVTGEPASTTITRKPPPARK